MRKVFALLVLTAVLAACKITQETEVKLPVAVTTDTTKKVDTVAKVDTGKTPPKITASPSSGVVVSLVTNNGVCQATIQFVATVTNGNGSPIVWSTTGGSITQTGLFTATKAEVDTVTASTQGVSTSVIVTVMGTCVVPPPAPYITFVPNSGTVPKGGTLIVVGTLHNPPAGVDDTLIWDSSDPSRVAVAQQDGYDIVLNGVVVVKAAKGGTLYGVFPGGQVTICAHTKGNVNVKGCTTGVFFVQ